MAGTQWPRQVETLTEGDNVGGINPWSWQPFHFMGTQGLPAGAFLGQRLETFSDFGKQVAFGHLLPPIHA